MDEQQTLFTYLVETLSKSYDVYDGMLPPEGAAYPFIYIGENQYMDDLYKGSVGATITQTIHVYHNNVRKRGTMSKIIADIKAVCREMEESAGWLLTSCSAQILPDSTTSEPLLHGVIDVTFRK